MREDLERMSTMTLCTTIAMIVQAENPDDVPTLRDSVEVLRHRYPEVERVIRDWRERGGSDRELLPRVTAAAMAASGKILTSGIHLRRQLHARASTASPTATPRETARLV
jgi:hypothetical protein